MILGQPVGGMSLSRQSAVFLAILLRSRIVKSQRDLLAALTRSAARRTGVAPLSSLWTAHSRARRCVCAWTQCIGWRAGVRGMAQWVYRGGNVYEQAYGLGTAYVFPATDGKPLPTIYWEMMREAITDQRYGATLTKLIAMARKSGNARARGAADQAIGVIRDVLSRFSLDYMNRRLPAGIWREFHLNSVDGAYYDTCRWRIAQEIPKLQAVLGDKAVLDPHESVFPLVPEDTMLGQHGGAGEGIDRSGKERGR